MSIGIGRVVATTLFSCCCLLVALPDSTAAARSGGSSGPLYNAIFNFGDSASDTGNLCVDGRPGPAGVLGIFTRLPYGVTYFRKPTCRCSDGRVDIDFLAQAFGLPFPLPSKARRKDFQRGANMAIIGGTVLDYSNASLKFTAYDGSMNTQIDNFQQLLPSIQNSEHHHIWCGGNCKALWFSLCLQSFVVFHLSMFESSNKSDYDKYGCLRSHNALFKRHNSFLQSSLPKLQKKHPRTRIMYADLASHIYQIVQDPRKFGFETALMSCCGKASAPHRFDPFTLCGMDGSNICHDPGSHLLWDGMHLSDTANRRIAEGWLSGPYCHPPILQ